MVCNCYYNGKGFKVGRRYVSIVTPNGRVIERAELTDYIISELEDIKAKYDSLDARRTREVIDLVCGTDEDYDDYDDWM